jgi:hypothetical protein
MNIALIMGCARSGTSILGELIGAHPDVKYKHEAHAIWNKAGLGENESHRLTAQHATPEVKRQIRRRFELEKGEAALLVEKCPRSALRIPFIREVFPEAKLIHIIRDGRDVACSMLPGIGGSEWRHLKPPNWKKIFEQDRGAVRCARAWSEIIEIALNDLDGASHFALKYEELIAEPAQIAGNLLRFLELPEHPAVDEFCKKIQNTTANSYQAQKQAKWFQDDHQVRIGRWRENLKQDEAEAIEKMLRPFLIKLRYVTH